MRSAVDKGRLPEDKRNEMTTGIALVGCGYVADSYRYCLRLHSDRLSLTGVFDRDANRQKAFTDYWNDPGYSSLDELLADGACKIVVNLTDPENHEAVTLAAIEAGKHVYSEKPVAMNANSAKVLSQKASSSGLRLASAPCNFLGESVQTAWRAIRDGKIGRVRLVYAELDDGMVHRAGYSGWVSRSGRVWPARGEFEIGCTYEHAGYALGPLIAMFGPVQRAFSYSSILVPDKQTTPPLEHPAPDFSCGCLEFEDGIVARITNSIVAPYNHRFIIVGDEGTLEICELWNYGSPVIFRRSTGGRLERFLARRFPGVAGRKLSHVRKSPLPRGRGIPTMDFMRGVAELADAIANDRPSKLDADLAVHITEVTEILQHPERFSRPAEPGSSCKRLGPEEWANR